MFDLSQYVVFLDDEFARIVEYLITSSTLDKNRCEKIICIYDSKRKTGYMHRC